MRQFEAKILRNDRVAPGFYKMHIESLYLARNIKPGQFIEVRCSDGIDPLLRRPFGAHRILKDGIEMLYEIVGRGTEILSGKKPGEYLDTIGPLGNGFSLDPATQRPNRPNDYILIAGGIGVAPLLALAEKLPRRKDIHVLIGACKKEHILCELDFKKLGAKVLVSTENGSKGYKGRITDVLRRILDPMTRRPNRSNGLIIYACGPNAMLREVARIAGEKRISCQVSLEERMACGVGVCLGCPVKVKKKMEDGRWKMEEYKMVCKDGPVFSAEEIIW